MTSSDLSKNYRRYIAFTTGEHDAGMANNVVYLYWDNNAKLYAFVLSLIATQTATSRTFMWDLILPGLDMHEYTAKDRFSLNIGLYGSPMSPRWPTRLDRKYTAETQLKCPIDWHLTVRRKFAVFPVTYIPKRRCFSSLWIYMTKGGQAISPFQTCGTI